MAAAYEAQRRAFEALQRSAAALAEALDRKLPELSEGVTRMEAGAAAAAAPGAAEEQALQVGKGGVVKLPRLQLWQCSLGCNPEPQLRTAARCLHHRQRNCS